MKKIIASLVAIAIVGAPIAAVAQSAGGLQFPNLNVADRGARLGIITEGFYTWNGIPVVKVISVDYRSGLNGVIFPGDFIYSVNGFNLRGPDDISAIVSPGNPGSTSTVYFLETRNGYRAMKVDVQTGSAAFFNSAPSVAASTSTSSSTSTSANSQSFCAEHYIICGIGALLVVGAVASAASGSSGPSSAPSKRNYPDDDYYRNRNASSSSSSQAREESRSYGLYGNCPQSGAGYGC